MVKHSVLTRANGVRIPADPREWSLHSRSLKTEEEHMAAGRQSTLPAFAPEALVVTSVGLKHRRARFNSWTGHEAIRAAALSSMAERPHDKRETRVRFSTGGRDALGSSNWQDGGL